jgi:hypothetical protein
MNVTQKEAGKLNFKKLSTKIQRTWNMKRFVIMLIIETTGIAIKRLKYLEKLPGKHSL